MSEYISVYDNVLDADTCKEIITRFEDDSDYHELTYNAGFRRFVELNIEEVIRSNDNRIWKSLRNSIYSCMKHFVEQYAKDNNLHASQLPSKYAFEEIRIKKYNINDTEQNKFDWHVDVRDHASAKRFLVGIFYLNDVIVGGETLFTGDKTPIAPKAGRLLMMPSTWTNCHKGDNPIDNSKYIMNVYCHYV
jgi:hypothetical protein